jgi:hypothetical protein
MSAAAAARQHAQDIDTVLRQVELKQLEVAGVARVTRGAIQEAMTINLTRKLAEQAAPDGAEQYALLAWQGVFGMARRIDALDAGW